MKLSVITPFLNEAENLPVYRARMEAVLKELDVEHELVLVDDHSTDAGGQFVSDWANEDPRVVYIRLARTSGSHSACSAGLMAASGDCAALLAADLQDPPETIPELLAKRDEGFNVVWAARESREGESFSTKAFAAIYYWIMRRLALPDMPKQGADFLLLDRNVIDAYNQIPEKHTSFLAMILWIGFRQTTIKYAKKARFAGHSKWTVRKKIKLMIDSLVSFSYAPIRMMSLVGFAMAVAGFGYAAFVVIGRFFGLIEAGTGFAAIMIVLLVGQGLILTMMGVLGEYLWRTFDEARGRPRYVIEAAINVAGKDSIA